MVANNVLATCWIFNDFVAGFALLLKPERVATFEFPHLLKLVQENQFDTIYHEHFSYLSLTAVSTTSLPPTVLVFSMWTSSLTHGGSLRVRPARRHRAASAQRPCG